MSSFCETSESFVLQVTSDNLTPEIPHGSIIIVDPAQTVRNNDFVVVKVSGRIELGRIFQKGKAWQLATSNHPPHSRFDMNVTDVVGRVVKCLDSKRNLIRDFG